MKARHHGQRNSHRKKKKRGGGRRHQRDVFPFRLLFTHVEEKERKKRKKEGRSPIAGGSDRGEQLRIDGHCVLIHSKKRKRRRRGKKEKRLGRLGSLRPLRVPYLKGGKRKEQGPNTSKAKLKEKGHFQLFQRLTHREKGDGKSENSHMDPPLYGGEEEPTAALDLFFLPSGKRGKKKKGGGGRRAGEGYALRFVTVCKDLKRKEKIIMTCDSFVLP